MTHDGRAISILYRYGGLSVMVGGESSWSAQVSAEGADPPDLERVREIVGVVDGLSILDFRDEEPEAHLAGCRTASDLLDVVMKTVREDAKGLGLHLPVFIKVPEGARPGEYVPLSAVVRGDLWDQNADGDPAYYGFGDVLLVECGDA